MQTSFACALQGQKMAIYHCSIKTIGRSAGRSAVASASYRSGERLKDERTGEVYDYTRKSGVEHTELIMPEGVNLDREQLWNAAESSERRKNSTVAREYEVALPEELNPEQRTELARDFARYLVKRYGVAVDVSIHAPGREGDRRNYHAHILTTTRQVTPEGFGSKTRVLDDRKTGEVEHVRAQWAYLTNLALQRAGHVERVSHKSLEAQGIGRLPTSHLGPIATAMERRGIQTERGDLNRGTYLGLTKEEQKELVVLEHLQQGIKTAREWYSTETAAREKAVLEQQEREAEEKRQREVKAIMEQIDREQAARTFWKATSPNMTYTERKKSVDIALAKWDTSTPEERRKQENEASWRGIRIQMEKRKQDLEREQERKLQRSQGRGGGWGR